VLPTAANVRIGLKKTNWPPKSGIQIREVVVAHTQAQSPELENRTPRARPATGWLKKSAGKSLVFVDPAGHCVPVDLAPPTELRTRSVRVEIPERQPIVATAGAMSPAAVNTCAT
jgi:hypothetical protein